MAVQQVRDDPVQPRQRGVLSVVEPLPLLERHQKRLRCQVVRNVTVDPPCHEAVDHGMVPVIQLREQSGSVQRLADDFGIGAHTGYCPVVRKRFTIFPRQTAPRSGRPLPL
jgi:hypothetical protein